MTVLTGTGMAISRSNLPGRLRAGSRALGRLVAPITTVWPRAPEEDEPFPEAAPSMRVRS